MNSLRIAALAAALAASASAQALMAGSNAANSFSASGWTGEATDCFSFGFTAAPGYTVDLQDLYIGSRSAPRPPTAAAPALSV